MNFILVIFLTASGLACQACFKKTVVKLELLTDINRWLKKELGVKYGIIIPHGCRCKQFAWMGNV